MSSSWSSSGIKSLRLIEPVTMNVFVFVLILQGNILNYVFLKIYKQLFKKIENLLIMI